MSSSAEAHDRRRLSADDESRQMARIALGDAAAFERLMATYWQPLLGYAASMLQDPAAGEDVAQEVFVRVWARRTEWKSTGSVRRFLYRIARNLVLDETRRRRSLRSRLRLFRASAPRSAESAAQPAERAALRAALEAAIQALPERRREAFVLVHRGGLSYREAGEVMGIAPQTVANQLTSALATLRQSLSHFRDDPPDA